MNPSWQVSHYVLLEQVAQLLGQFKHDLLGSSANIPAGQVYTQVLPFKYVKK